MRVIKATNSNEWPKRCECDNCGTMLEYDKKDEYVLVCQIVAGQRDKELCFVGKLNRRNWWSNMINDVAPCSSTDRWCHIDLPEE